MDNLSIEKKSIICFNNVNGRDDIMLFLPFIVLQNIKINAIIKISSERSFYMKIIKKMNIFMLTFIFSANMLIFAGAAENSDFEILQDKDDGVIAGEYYLPTNPETITWGRLPNRNSKPVITIKSGSTITIDTLSHEGLLEDQGKNPVEYFKSKGVSENQILKEGAEITSADKTHNFDNDGPHIVTGPVYIEGAQPGDVLKVEVLSLTPRVPYGVITNRHYKGVLVNEFPENEGRLEGASPENYEKYNNVSIFTPIKKQGEGYVAYLNENGKEITFPINPFLGIMGTAANSDDVPSSIPPTKLGGNLDINELGVGSTLYLPIEVAGALFFTGDPHFAQGDGEVALTALEGSLRGDLRLTVLKKGSSQIPGNANNFDMAFGETEDYWIPVGLNEDLDEAMKQSVRESIDFLSEQLGVDRKVVYAYLSGATDYEVSQAVDKTKGIHALVSKKDFRNFVNINLKGNDKVIGAYIKDDGIYVKADEIFGLLKAECSYADGGAALNVKYNNSVYTFKMGSNKYIKDGATKTLTKSPYYENGKLYVPTVAILKLMDIPLTWSTDGTSITGTIGY